MEDSRQQITAKQGNRIFILEIFSAAALFLPQMALKENRHSAVLSVAVVWVLAGLYVLAASKTAKGIPMERVLKEYRWAALLYYVRFLINGAFFYAYVIFMAETYMLRQKQSIVVGLPLLLLAYQMNHKGLRGRGRAMEGIFWFVLLPVIFVLLLSAADLSFHEIAVTSFQWKEFAKGSLLLLALLHPIELVWFYRGSMEGGGMKFKTFLAVGMLFLGIFLAVVGSLGKELTMLDDNPVMSMAQGVAIPGGLMARLDIFLIAFWIVGVFCVLSGYLFYGNEGIEQAFGRKGKILGRILSYGGLLLGTNFLLSSWDMIWEHFSLFLYGNLAAGLLLPMILFLLIRRRMDHETKK
nr:GerAB/ArcD/ProY family transporter [uncultured Anaerostipes sp.]